MSKETTPTNGSDFLLIPHRYTADFESGSVGAWSSYPPFQDTGYDYSILVKRVEGYDAGALVREVTPDYAGDFRFGVRKKFPIYVDADSTLTFRFYIKSFNGTEGVLLKFAFGDSGSVETKIPAKTIMRWEQAEIRFDKIIGKDEIKQLSAVAFIALCPDADPESLHRFAITDVEVNGLGMMPFKIAEPDGSWLEEFRCFVLKKHFNEGGAVRVTGEFPAEAGVTKAEAALSRALTGKDGKRFLMEKCSGGWELNVPPPGPGKGMWRAEIEGTGVGGKKIISAVVFLVTPKTVPSGHPRLLISEEDKEKILENIKKEPYQKIWGEIKSKAASPREKYEPDDYNFNYHLDAFDADYWLATVSGYNTVIRQPGKLARSNGLVYFLKGSVCAGEAVKATLLKMADWTTWLHPHLLKLGQSAYFPVGMSLADFSLGYDMVYGRLTKAERKKIADSFFHNGIEGVFDEYVKDNRVSSDTSNWIAHITGGGILGALAIKGEYSDAELEPYLTGMILKLGEFVNSTFDGAGNYGEGYSYHCYTLQTLAETMAALERNLGIQFPQKVFDSYEYMFYQVDPGAGKVYDFGDARSQMVSMTYFVYILNQNKNSQLKWLYDKKPGTEDMDLFYYDDTIEAKAPDDLPKTVLFEDVGTAVFRSGFKHEDFAFIFRCGPFYNHQHFDHGSFYLLDGGEELVSEPGRTDYYADPWYRKLFIQPGGHNCILVDENVESQMAGGDLLHDVAAWGDHGKMSGLVQFKGGAFVSGDLTGLYKGKFKGLTRGILYLEPRTVIIIDKGIGAVGVRHMNLRFH
ncbi:MAG: hypothetical protein GY950_31360, partial [bacterium]|nr:hypothetical protein [bacterium]